MASKRQALTNHSQAQDLISKFLNSTFKVSALIMEVVIIVKILIVQGNKALDQIQQPRAKAPLKNPIVKLTFLKQFLLQGKRVVAELVLLEEVAVNNPNLNLKNKLKATKIPTVIVNLSSNNS